MRPIRSGAMFAAALMLAPAAISAQGTFEGTVSYSMTTPQGMTMDMVQHVKGDRMRADVAAGPMGSMVILYDMKESKITMLVPAQKMYMSMDQQTAMEMAGQQGKDMSNAKMAIKKTGEKETIAGHPCEHVEMTMNEHVIDYCAATDLGFYFGGSPPSGGRGGNASANLGREAQEMLRKEFPKGFFPVKISMDMGAGSMTMTATKIEKGSVSDDMFAIPSDYTEMPGMGGRGRGGR
jgi:Domain of unknown function (DUF4412)